MTAIPPLDDDRMIALVGAVVRKAIKDAAAGYMHPTHPDPRAFLAVAGLLERVEVDGISVRRVRACGARHVARSGRRWQEKRTF